MKNPQSRVKEFSLKEKDLYLQRDKAVLFQQAISVHFVKRKQMQFSISIPQTVGEEISTDLLFWEWAMGKEHIARQCIVSGWEWSIMLTHSLYRRITCDQYIPLPFVSHTVWYVIMFFSCLLMHACMRFPKNDQIKSEMFTICKPILAPASHTIHWG